MQQQATALKVVSERSAPTARPAIHSVPNLKSRNASSEHLESEGISMKPSYPITSTTVLPAEGRVLAKKIQAVILPFRIADVADHANRTNEAVKKWRQADACPDLASSINLARGIPAIKWLIYQEIEGGTPDGVFSPKLVVAALAMLQQIADGGGEHAAAARAILEGGRA